MGRAEADPPGCGAETLACFEGFSNIPGAFALASGRTGSIYGSAAEIGRELAEAWESNGRADQVFLASEGARKERVYSLGAVINRYTDALHEVLAETPARTVDDALAQALVGGALTSEIEDVGAMDRESIERQAALVRKLLDSVIRFLAMQTATPAAALGGGAYLTAEMQAELERLTGRATA